MKKARSYLSPVVVASVAAALTYVAYTLVQPVYTYTRLDVRFDAHEYARAYAYFAGEVSSWQVAFPFHGRVLAPCLAALMPFDSSVPDFIGFNALCAVLTIAGLVYLWSKWSLRGEVLALGVFWILFHWKGLMRMYLPDPLTADVAGYLLQTLWIIALVNQWPRWAVWFLALLGASQKESFLVVVGVSMLWAWWAQPSHKYLYLSALIMATATHLIINFYFPPITSDWRNSPVVTLLRGLKRYALQPELLLRLPISWLLAFGGLWLGALRRSFSRHSFLTWQFLSWMVLSVFGGGDTTRILYNGMPFVLSFLLVNLNQKPAWVTYYAFVVSLPLMRLGQLEPDLGLHPQLTHAWCVECWSWQESWGYWLYASAVLGGYYYLAGRLGSGRDEPHKIHPRS